MNKKSFGILICSFFIFHIAGAQIVPPGQKTISFSAYMDLVSRRNPALAVEQLHQRIAESNISTAGVRPDPELSLDATDNGERKMKMGYEFGGSLAWTVELGGKRQSRLSMARNQHALTKIELEDYVRNLRADAASMYFSAYRDKLLYEAQKDAYENMLEIARADSLRFSFGEISRITAMQSSLEARKMQNELVQAKTEWQNSLTYLSLYTSEDPKEFLWNVEGDFKKIDQQYQLADLIRQALGFRTDVAAASQRKLIAEKMIDFEKANRATDIGMYVGVNRATYAHNDIAPTPAHTPVSAGVTIPLRLSNKRNNAVKSAQLSLQQADLDQALLEQQVVIEITRSYQEYQSLQTQVQAYREGMLSDAKTILDGKKYSYQKGESSLLEVLDAQRTYNELQQSYYDTLFRYAEALVELQRAAGIWDIEF